MAVSMTEAAICLDGSRTLVAVFPELPPMRGAFSSPLRSGSANFKKVIIWHGQASPAYNLPC